MLVQLNSFQLIRVSNLIHSEPFGEVRVAAYSGVTEDGGVGMSRKVRFLQRVL